MNEQIETKKENKMGVMPVGRLLLTMSIPMVISMLVQALYNVVDSMFVAQISENALTAVSLAFPAQNLMIAVATGTGVGINALLSRSLGEKNFRRANNTADNAVFLALCSFIAFALIGGIFSRVFFRLQTDVTEIIDYGTAYLQICTIGSIGLFLQVTFEKLLQATGRTFYTMLTQGLGAIINIVLDPILIFGLLGMPKMGVAGAAVATICGQIIASILAVVLNMKKNHEIELKFKGFRPSKLIIARIYSVGVPSIMMAAIGSVMTFGINKILISFTTTATAVFGVYFKLQSFVFMPIFGLNNGMVPIIAYNYGARRKDRLMKTVKLSMVYAVAIMAVGLVIMQLIPDKILLIFNASDDMLRIGVPAMRIISICFPLAGYNIITSSTFQALGRGIQSMLVSIIRQLVVLLPAAWLLAKLGEVTLVWWAYPIAELSSLLLCTLFFLGAYRTIIKPMDHPGVKEAERNNP